MTATDDPVDDLLAELPTEETRQQLIRLIARQDIESHADIYEELARE